MRAHSNEHTDCLPVIDIASLRHVAYVFDALIYYMRSGTDTDIDVLRDGISVISWQDHDENENEEHDDDGNNAMSMDTESIDGDSELGGKIGRKHPFFQRSESTICLGCPPPDPFHTPLVDAIPLADQPHLLQPNARKEDLFGVAKQAVVPPPTVTDVKTPAGMENALDKLPIHLSLSVRMPESPVGAVPVLPTETVPTTTSLSTETPVSASSASVIVRPGTFQPAGFNQNLTFAPATSGSSAMFDTPPMAGTSSYPIGPYDTPIGFVPPRYIQPNIVSFTVPPTSLVKAEVHQPSVIVHSSTAISANVSTSNTSSASASSLTVTTAAVMPISVSSSPVQVNTGVLRLEPSSSQPAIEPVTSTTSSVSSIIVQPSSTWSMTPSVVTMVTAPMFSSTPSVELSVSQSETPMSVSSQSTTSTVVRSFESSHLDTPSGNFMYHLLRPYCTQTDKNTIKFWPF